jgi:hypothetical protein
MEPEKSREITKEEYKEFVEECKKWIEIFGLKDWKVDYLQEDLEGNWAECRVNGVSNRNVVIVLNKKVNESDEKLINIKRTAFHEVVELLIYPLEYLAECRFLQPEEIIDERHSIIRRLENSLFEMENK